ncbi:MULTISPECIES: ribosome-associated translation inhibitor RaiA [Rhodomicrobium]|uniref:ribosome hibernation-promoting factor, HPF/YfiA family n=1 Tax=Rhodomicrobium TaxID=1068 RepID=UPI000B4B3366|nr:MULTISPECIES: ribosome-associated translation inhibitor RaiA [Rhodomicrobium]
MAIQVTGKNIDLGSALRSYVLDKLEKAFEKYGSQGLSGHIFIEKEHGRFATTCAVHMASGLSLQSHGSAAEAHPSVDEAMDRLEKRLRRYKRRLKNHHPTSAPRNSAADIDAIDYTLRHEDGEQDADSPELAPAIVAETRTAIRVLSVSDAVMEMDLADKSFLIFANASHGRVNVVYRREDGHVGWIDPGGLSAQEDRED